MIDRLTAWGEYRRNHTQALKADAQRIERVFKSLDPFDQAILVNRFVIPLTFRRLTAEQVADITADVIRDFTDRLSQPPTGKPVVMELLPTGLSHSKIAALAKVSREYVGQCARATQPTKRQPTQGS